MKHLQLAFYLLFLTTMAGFLLTVITHTHPGCS